ncbi:hypothetical protein HPP92_006147 [Vanilla planifolia]|uniref:Succinate dehydrogenase assembly factor 2, mitochondrial n=1 Tax=Vanilla planifolia TaxID=51239 RepID=A0A835S061_VANPL|nr:hypothetical protein HPP92_006440 [Vanilla planifolia]KAG0495153.1 hypothetical protein HPP92_006147 [Vanilla planifolia]
MASLRQALLRLRKPPTLRSAYTFHRGSIGQISRCSGGTTSNEVDLSDEESTRRLHNRLLYRSRQRGFLELDLILGKWVEENIRSMNETTIRSLVDVLDLENPDLWKWLSGQEQPPDAVNNNPVFKAIHGKVLQNLSKHAAPSTRADPGRPWVRGWDDKRGLDGGPSHGNQ